MNAISAEIPTRFACRLTRGWISILGDGTRALQNAHVAGCPDCQAFFAAADDLELALRRDAVPQRATAPAYLEQDIISAVRRSTRPARRRYTLPVFGLAGVAAAIAGLIVVLEPKPSPAPLDLQAFADPIAELKPKAQAILQQDPLGNEANALVANARSAVRFLARNFLPSDVELTPAHSSG